MRVKAGRSLLPLSVLLCLRGMKKLINCKLAEAMGLGAEGLNISWEGLRRTEGGLVAADLTISALVATVKYNVYLRGHDILLQFRSTNRNRAELAARLLKTGWASAAEIGKGGLAETSGAFGPLPTGLRPGARSSEKPSPRSSERPREQRLGRC
jgi:hypothetical protein